MGTNLLVGYTGAYQDAVTGGYSLGNGYRMYLPELMRFNSPDSWSPFGKGGIHAYAYCAGDPINHADPSGHFSVLSLMVEAIVAEEAANVAATVNGLVDEVAADGGLSAARATRATAAAVEDGGASSSRAAESVRGEAGEPPAKRSRQGEPEVTRSPGPDEPGPSGQQAPGLAPPFEDLRRAHVRGRLDALEQSMRDNMDPLFNGGQRPTLRELYNEADFGALIQQIDQHVLPQGDNLLGNVLIQHQVALEDIRRGIPSQWDEELDQANRLSQEITENWRILDSAWNRDPRNPNRPVPN